MSTDAITYLKDQHDQTRKLLNDLETTTDRGVKTRTELLSKLDVELRHHMQLEEEIFYPAFKEAVKLKKDKVLYFEAKEEHAAADRVLKDMVRVDVASLAFGGKAKVLKELVEHHIEEEEEGMFPIAKEVFDKKELRVLGERMESRKKELESGRSWDRSAVANVS